MEISSQKRDGDCHTEAHQRIFGSQSHSGIRESWHQSGRGKSINSRYNTIRTSFYFEISYPLIQMYKTHDPVSDMRILLLNFFYLMLRFGVGTLHIKM